MRTRLQSVAAVPDVCFEGWHGLAGCTTAVAPQILLEGFLSSHLVNVDLSPSLKVVHGKSNVHKEACCEGVPVFFVLEAGGVKILHRVTHTHTCLSSDSPGSLYPHHNRAQTCLMGEDCVFAQFAASYM